MKQPIPKPDLEKVFEHYGAQILGNDNGGWRKAECPLTKHEDRNPSASVNIDECRWRCFSCNKSGDAVDLILENEHDIGWAAAIKLATGFLGEGSRSVPRERHGSGLLPRRSGGVGGGSSFVPPWKSL